MANLESALLAQLTMSSLQTRFLYSANNHNSIIAYSSYSIKASPNIR